MGCGAFVASADVEGAFDCIKHDDVERGLLQKGVHPKSVCSLLRESCDLKGRNNLPDTPMSPAFLYARGARQGSVDGPDMRNQVLDNALREPAARWESEGIGFRLATDYCKAQKRCRGSPGEAVKDEDRVLHHLCCADDDVYAMAGTTHHLTRILEDMTNAIERLGMRWKGQSLTIVVGPFTEYKAGDVVEIISNSGKRWVWRVVRGHGGTGYVAGQSRLLRGQLVAQNLQRQLHVLREEGFVLRSQTAGQEAYGIDAFHSTCAPAALHGAGELDYTQSMLQALRTWELVKLRRVLCLRRRPNECYADHMKRTGVIVARQLKKHNQPRLQTLAMRRVRIAAWQMVSCPSDAKGCRYWEESVTWRCVEMWRDEFFKLSKKDYRNSSQWKSPLPGRPNFWERNTWTEWFSLTKEFEHSWHVVVNLKPSESSSVCDPPAERAKRPRDDRDPWNVAWSSDTHGRLEVLGDNKIVIR